jgi:regulator of PEP synthase PpsR (kinase-PPPase family)
MKEATMPDARARTIFIVSDGTGHTCEQVVRSALGQFGGQPVDLILRPGVRGMTQIRRIADEAAATRGVVFFTLVTPDARRELQDAAAARGIEAIDVLGPVLTGLATSLDQAPREDTRLHDTSQQEHVDRIDAVEFTLEHDDGQQTDGLRHADVVLAGVSRTSKTSTCFYLAFQGIRAANVPLLPHAEPPRELAALDPHRVIGLTMSVDRLMAIRRARLARMGASNLDMYVDAEAVMYELRTAHERMADHRWRRLDVSHMAVEEIAHDVQRLMKEAKLRRRPRRRRARR